ncbi:hypothetical protein BJ322DRAFT_1035109 [Thelephora terrestris]|uniref:DUF6593 domain-containing protein n=1 Tax=Thelephora terrestris TaxID=56493 RepID=A0A9P6HRN8_9AGAM|nr:hypothetical protein BJ322DRAFT_1035109 [Thelephora terrestris]
MSGCTLQLTRNSALRTTLVDAASGHAKYQIDTPRRIARRMTRIKKLDSTEQYPIHLSDADSDSDDDVTVIGESESKKGMDDGEEEDEAMTEVPEASDDVARIYWNWFSSDKIVFQGKITTRSEFLPKCGKMKGSFVFTGPDGVQYRWAMGALGMNYPKLVTADEKKEVIAEFHRAHYITKRKKARIEVQLAGMGMLDYIVLTFVFAEEKRRERERRTRSGG